MIFPSIEEFERRISNTLSFYPYLTYAYASRLRGKKHMIGMLKPQFMLKMSILSMYACISASVDEESNSILFHKHLGYKMYGRFLSVDINLTHGMILFGCN